jgi:hypothetical protein
MRSSWVNGIVLLDRTGKDPCSFVNTTYCIGGTAHAGTQDTLISLMTCRSPGMSNITFMRENYMDCLLDAYERGGSLVGRSLKAMLPDDSLPDETTCTALADLRSLTLHGFASHLIYTLSSSRSDTTSMALPILKHLTLNALHLKNVEWPCMPMLTTLAITCCRFGTWSLPIRAYVPRLRTLVWVRISSAIRGGNDSGIIPFVVALGAELFSLTLDYAIFRRMTNSVHFSRVFPALRELCLGRKDGLEFVTPQPDILEQAFTRRMSALRLSPFFYDVLVSFAPACAQRMLATDVVACSLKLWGEVCVIGDASFWEQVAAWYLYELRAACTAAGVVYTQHIGPFGQSRIFCYSGLSLTIAYSSRLAVACSAMARPGQTRAAVRYGRLG